MSNPIEARSDRVRPLPAPSLELHMLGVVRMGEQRAEPLVPGQALRVGDRLVGRYHGRGLGPRAELQLAVRARAPGPRPVSEDPSPAWPSEGCLATGEVWELDTSHMGPGEYALTLRLVSRALDGATPRCHGAVTLGFHLSPPA